MIEFYTAATGNGRRPALMLEECGLAYTAHKLDLSKGESHTPEYLKINPAGAIPAIVDPEGPGGKPLVLAQSGAILIYLAEKTGKLLPKDAAGRAVAGQWLMAALTDVAPTSSAIFYSTSRDPESATVGFFKDRLVSLLGAFDARLATSEYLAGDLSIADLALYPVYDARRALIEASALPNLKRWADAVGGRPAVRKGMAVA